MDSRSPRDTKQRCGISVLAIDAQRDMHRRRIVVHEVPASAADDVARTHELTRPNRNRCKIAVADDPTRSRVSNRHVEITRNRPGEQHPPAAGSHNVGAGCGAKVDAAMPCAVWRCRGNKAPNDGPGHRTNPLSPGQNGDRRPHGGPDR